MTKKYPYQKGIPTKYMPDFDEEPMAGPASKVSQAPEEQKRGFQFDAITHLQSIETLLNNNFYHLNRETMDVEALSTPDWPTGINPDPTQLIKKDKSTQGVVGRRNLIGVLTDELLDEYELKLAKGLYDPRATKSKYELEQIVKWAQEWESKESVCNKNYRGQISPRNTPYTSTLPRVNQFDEKVRQLEFKDIFTIFEGTQLEQIKMFLGRVCVGESGTIDPMTGERLLHTYRNIVVVDGSYPGQGKSTLFQYLAKALTKAGYDVNEACPPLNGRFNLKKPFISDMVLRDDETSSNLGKELASPNAKIMATNGTLATEEKGEQAEMTKCTTAMIILANRLESRLFWGMDDGMRSRITCCETSPEGAISDSLLPHNNLPALAEKLQVDIETIMLWACRLATDEFLKYCNENSQKLETHVKELEASANKSNSDPLDGVMSSIALGYLLETDSQKLPKYLNPDIIAIGLTSMLKLKQSQPGYQDLVNTLAKTNGHYIIPGWHPVQGLILSDPRSVLMAYKLSVESNNLTITTNKQIRNILETISLRDGNQCYGRSDVVMNRWTQLVSNKFTHDRLLDLKNRIISYKKGSAAAVTDINYALDPFMELR